jgi:phytoene synthase
VITSTEFRADPSDHARCRDLHRQYGTTYFYATQRFSPAIRRRVHALYGFVRLPDEWVDNPDGNDPAGQLANYRRELLVGLSGERPSEPVLRAFCEVAREVQLPPDEPLLFLDAMVQDLSIARYSDYAALRHYMRGSASAVGLMMCEMLEAGANPVMLDAAQALGEAMQLTNFLRDIREDLVRGRIYLPQDEMASFGVTENDLQEARVTPAFVALMKFEIDRARALYRQADAGIPLLPTSAQKAVRLARVLYSRILDRIEQRQYDVFGARARTTPVEKVHMATRVLLNLPC